MVPINERVTSYSISELRNTFVDYQQVVRFTTETDFRVFIAFPNNPPGEWLTITGKNITVYLERGEFDRIHHLLQTESPLFFSALRVQGNSIFNLSSGTELPGEGPADDDALVQLMAKVKAGLTEGSVPAEIRGPDTTVHFRGG